MREIAKIADLKERQAIAEAKTTAFIRGNLRPQNDPLRPESSQTNVQKLQEETGRELLEMENRYMQAQQMAKSNADELLRIDREYLAAKEQLQSEYDIKVVEARNADRQNQLAFYSQMLSQTSAVWGSMTQMVKDAKGENSKTFKAMFLAQQSMAIAQQIINTELAAGATTAQTGIFGLPAAAVIRGIGYASVGLIAAQTIAGFANGGYTGHGAKYEPAGIVHKGEGVLTQEEVKALGGPQGFEDLRKSIRRGYATGGLVTDTHRVGMGAVSAINSGGANNSSLGGSGDVNITVHVTDSGVSTQSSQNEQKQLGQMIGNAVRTIIRQEQRQGGLLSKWATANLHTAKI